jgi:hypothetical protein
MIAVINTLANGIIMKRPTSPTGMPRRLVQLDTAARNG